MIKIGDVVKTIGGMSTDPRMVVINIINNDVCCRYFDNTQKIIDVIYPIASLYISKLFVQQIQSTLVYWELDKDGNVLGKLWEGPLEQVNLPVYPDQENHDTYIKYPPNDPLANLSEMSSDGHY